MRVILYYDTMTLGKVVPLESCESTCSMDPFGSRAARSERRRQRATMNEISDDDEVRANGTEYGAQRI